jgi:predicted lipoprotein with Yx(FWY)xxD motif
MSGLSPTSHPARLTGVASFALVITAALVACSTAATTPPSVAPATASPAAIASGAPTASPGVEAASGSPSPAASPSAAASPSPTSGGGRYGTGGATPTPAPTPRSTPKPTSRPTPTPAPKPVSIVVKTRSTGVGTVLVGPNGLTLYTLKSDPTNGSGCTGDCAANWPPFLVKTGTTIKGGSGVSGTFASFARSGKRQVTYKGRALYYFAGDSYAGDTNGQGINHVWYVATP